MRPAFYALRPGRLARLRDAAAPAVHGLAPRPTSSSAAASRPRSRGAGSGSPCSRSSSRWASAPTRSTSSPAGRCRRRSPPRCSSALAVVSVAAACAIGLAVAFGFSLWILPLIAVGAFLVPAYNLELFGGRFHSDLWFAARVGRLPRRHRRVACAGTVSAAARPRRGLGDRPLPRAAPALDPGAATCDAGSRHRGRARAARTARRRAGHARAAARRGTRGGAAAARGGDDPARGRARRASA